MTPSPAETSGNPSDLDRLLGVVRRRAGLIALGLLGTSAIVVGFSLLQQKEYSSSASLLFRNTGFAEELFGAPSSAQNPAREVATNEKLLRLDVVSARTAKQFKGLSPDEVSAMVSVSVAGEADLVTVTATSPRPAQAMRVANSFARQFIAFRANADRGKLLQAKELAEQGFEQLSAVEQGGVRGKSLTRAIEKLGVMASLQTGNAELVQPADLPTSPSSPKPVRNGILGGIIGLLLSIGLAFVLERLNRKLSVPEEARDAFALPVLGTVPESKAIAASNEGSEVVEQLPFLENEAFRTMRAALRYFNVDRELRSVLVTSYAAGTGKSTVSWNLGRVAASASDVLVVEADMRNPYLATQHGLTPGPGLAELLTGQVSLGQAIQRRRFSVGGNGADGTERELDVIVAGSNPPNPGELIESEAMDRLLAQLADRYDLVIVDIAPTGVVSDAFPLLRKVDGVLVVARLGHTTRDAATAMREQLDRLEAPVLGLVVNGVKMGRQSKYGYGYYGGGHGDRPAPAKQPEGAAARGGGAAAKA